MSRATTEIAQIRKLIKAQVPGVSVRNGRGTAYGWVEISGSGEYGNFTPEQFEGLKALGIAPCANFAVIPPLERGAFIERLS